MQTFEGRIPIFRSFRTSLPSSSESRVNTDKRDARAIASRLDRFLAGNDEALVKVRIPTELEEDQRAVCRQRDQFMKARKRVEAQGRSLLYFKGLSCPSYW